MFRKKVKNVTTERSGDEKADRILIGSCGAVVSHGGNSDKFAKRAMADEEAIQRIILTGVPRESAELIVHPPGGLGMTVLFKAESGW